MIKEELYKVDPIDSIWLGVGAYCDAIDISDSFRTKELSTGWIVTGYFLNSNTGSSFINFVAYHKSDPSNIVFGDYGTCGVFCKNKESLEKFTEAHPSLQID